MIAEETLEPAGAYRGITEISTAARSTKRERSPKQTIASCRPPARRSFPPPYKKTRNPHEKFVQYYNNELTNSPHNDIFR